MSYVGEEGYLDLMSDIDFAGIPHNDRTGTGTKRMIGQTMRFNLENNSIPMFTTKKVHWKSVVIELLWFLSGQTNVNFLKRHGVRIWNEWANEDGSLGPVYGEQMRHQSSTMQNDIVDSAITKMESLHIRSSSSLTTDASLQKLPIIPLEVVQYFATDYFDDEDFERMIKDKIKYIIFVIEHNNDIVGVVVATCVLTHEENIIIIAF
jgi:hypothetical protein